MHDAGDRCGSELPASSAGLIGDAAVTLAFSGSSFTTTFARAGMTFTSHGDASYPVSNNLSLMLTATSGIDESCIGKEVIYSFAWSDDCTLVGLTRDTENCEARINNLEGVTLATQK
jgi:hypothetical protein